MQPKIKILIIGPPASGKTTITKVFFKNANPLKLLRQSLEPTRGFISNLFTFFNSELSIFDLAGQENNYWFTKNQEIFQDVNTIICVFDIIYPVESIISFLLSVLKIQKRTPSLSKSKIFIFVHKIDNVTGEIEDGVMPLTFYLMGDYLIQYHPGDSKSLNANHVPKPMGVFGPHLSLGALKISHEIKGIYITSVMKDEKAGTGFDNYKFVCIAEDNVTKKARKIAEFINESFDRLRQEIKSATTVDDPLYPAVSLIKQLRRDISNFCIHVESFNMVILFF